MSAFVTLSWALAQLPIHPFILLAAMILVPPAFSLLSPLVLPARIRGPIDALLYGSSFALIGGTQAWWLVSLLNNPAQQNKLELALGMGFFALAFLVVGSSIVAAALLYWREGPRPCKVESDGDC